MRFALQGTESIFSLTYLIFGRGKLIFAETLPAGKDGSRFNELNFRAQVDMSPR